MSELREKIVALLEYAFPGETSRSGGGAGTSLRSFARRFDRRLVKRVDDLDHPLAGWLADHTILEGTVERLLQAVEQASLLADRPELPARIDAVRALLARRRFGDALGDHNPSSNSPPSPHAPSTSPIYSGLPVHPHPGKPGLFERIRLGLLGGDTPPGGPAPTAQPSHPAIELEPKGISQGDSAAPAGGSARPSSPPPLPPAALRPRVPEQQVSIGVSKPEEPELPLSSDRALAAATGHLLWVQISKERVAGAVGGVSTLSALRQDDELDVIVFPFPDQLVLDGPRHGRVRISRSGNQVVKRAWSERSADDTKPRLYFAFTTPEQPGRYALRCNIYCRGVLLQSHLVRAHVTAKAAEHQSAIDRVLDYNLTSNLDPACIPPDGDCKLSLFLNDDGKGTHSFRFVSSDQGVPDTFGDAHMEGRQLEEMVTYAREALRWTAWGTTKEWSGEACKLTRGYQRDELSTALVMMAKRGANLWLQLAERFSFVGRDAKALRERMRTPGRVQLALKESPDAVIPASLIYDYPLDVAKTDVRLCETSLAAIAAGAALAAEPCFQGKCPHYKDRAVVCAGGFWGFRHDLGLPLHLQRGEVASKISRGSEVRAFAAVSTDKNFTLRDGHLAELAKINKDWLEVLRSRDACLARIKEPRQIVYFYCHGGVNGESQTPFLEVGERHSEPIYAQSLFEAEVFWEEPVRPLVILNGCHTTATSPAAMFSMLTGFAAHCKAAGIIGTEITNFEIVASAFGRELIRRFVAGETIGAAVRMARLELLRKGNPLGLMYIPFALPSLRLE
jgi:hypothetical protein